jgi:hypothetical protein
MVHDSPVMWIICTFLELVAKAIDQVVAPIIMVSLALSHHGCPAQILLYKAHGIDSTRVSTLATFIDMRRTMPCPIRIA